MILTGILPGKQQWSRRCRNAAMDHEFSRWRIQLRLYRKLSDFRVIYTQIEASVWWLIARYNICLKKSCITMMRLIAGCSQLRIDCDTHLPRNERVCMMCDLGEIEDLFHMVIGCTYYNGLRKEMFERLENCLSPETYNSFERLPLKVMFYILLGMSFCFPFSDLWTLRVISCQGVRKMYEHRIRQLP